MSRRRPRSFHLDNTRTFLTALVIVHHASLPYGGFGSWMYSSRYHSFGSSAPILAFNVINQTYFMATFFLLSGYFTAIAAEKRSRRAFLREKWKRLGIPTLLYSILGPGPATAVVKIIRDGGGWKDGLQSFWQGVKGVRGVRGGVWYCALLLVFDALYALLRPQDFGTVRKQNKDEKTRRADRRVEAPKAVPDMHILLALVVSTASSLWLRTKWPLGVQFKLLSLNMGFVPQYVLFYVTGVGAYTYLGTELHSLATKRALLLLGVACVLITTTGIIILKNEIETGADVQKILEFFRGGWNRFAFIYAIWNEFTGVLLSSLLLQLFRRMFNKKWIIGGFDLARYSYPAFLVHIPVVVFLHCLMDQWKASGVLKTATVGPPGVIGSWIVGWLLVKSVEGIGYRGYI